MNKLIFFPKSSEPPHLYLLHSFNRIWGANQFLGQMQDLTVNSTPNNSLPFCHIYAVLLLHCSFRCHDMRMTFDTTLLSICSWSGPLFLCTKPIDQPVSVCMVFTVVVFDAGGVFRSYDNKVVTANSVMCTYSC